MIWKIFFFPKDQNFPLETNWLETFTARLELENSSSNASLVSNVITYVSRHVHISIIKVYSLSTQELRREGWTETAVIVYKLNKSL